MSLRKSILEKLHNSHLGVYGTLRRARKSVFWPGMSADIRNYIERFETCAAIKVKARTKEPLRPHERPPRPWAKVAVDMFAFEQRNFLVTVDYWSNFYEVDQLKSPEATPVIMCLKRHFARHGIPDVVISDNGPQFSSSALTEFA